MNSLEERRAPDSSRAAFYQKGRRLGRVGPARQARGGKP